MPGPVLMLMDYQEGICRAEGPIGQQGTGAQVAARSVLSNAARVLETFREAALPVVFVRVAFDDNYHGLTSASRRFTGMRTHRLMLRSDPAARICPEIAPRPDDIVIDKGCVNPFIGTNLAQTLVRLRAGELVMGGVATNHVVESAARHAADSGYPVVVLDDLCASFTPEAHEASLRYGLPFYAEIQTSEDYLTSLASAPGRCSRERSCDA